MKVAFGHNSTRHENEPLCSRSFLRHSAIGLKREHVKVNNDIAMFSSSSFSSPYKHRHNAPAAILSSFSPRRNTPVMLSIWMLMISGIISLILMFQSQSVSTTTTRSTMTETLHAFAGMTRASPTTTTAANINMSRNFMTHPVTADESNSLFRARRMKRRPMHHDQQRHHEHDAHRTKEENYPLDVASSDSKSDMNSPFLRVAVCHPTIFIPPNKLDDDNATNTSNNKQDAKMLQRFLAFASYYRLLGFDHLFFWYERPVSTLSYFDQLAALPYVTMTEYRDVRSQRKAGNDYHGQGNVEDLCLQDERFARLYDWVLNVDADEYLWLAPSSTTIEHALNTTNSTAPETRDGRHRLTIQEFLEPYHEQNFNYISIGKFLYSTKHLDREYCNDDKADDDRTTTSATNDMNKRNQSDKNDPFGLLKYPYTPGPYCYKTKRRPSGHPICPNWMGRSKLLVRPEYHPSVHVHGTNHGLMNRETGIHLHSLQQAHFKEWIWIHQPPQPSIIHYDNSSFEVTHNDQFLTYFLMESSRRDKDGKIQAYHDGQELREWFDFLSQQLSSLPNDDFNHNQVVDLVHKPYNSSDDRHSKQNSDTKATTRNKIVIRDKKKSRIMASPPSPMNKNNELQYSLSPAVEKHFLQLQQQLQGGRSAHKLQKLQSLLQQQQ
jgi:hypothetical protein